MLRFAAMLIALFAFAVGAAASDELGSMAWFKAEWEKAQRFELPPKVVVRYDFITYPSMTASEVDALAASIEEFPDHPSHFLVKRQRRLLSQGTDTETITIWFWDEENWRCNIDGQQELAPFVDFGRRGGNLWSYTPPQLTLTTMESMPHDRDYAAVLSIRMENLVRLLTCGFATGIGDDVVPKSSALKDGLLSAVAESSAGGKVVEWRGHMDGDILIFDQWTVLKNDQYPKSVGLTAIFDNWKEFDQLSQHIPTHSRWVGRGGHLLYETVLHDLHKLSKAEFNRVVRVPAPGREDVVRGEIDPPTLADFRPGKGVLVTFADDDAGISKSIVSMPMAVPPDGTRPLVWVGRVIAILALSLGVFVVWHRRS